MGRKAKMIINRNNIEYIYAEKIENLEGKIEYIVYEQRQPYLYNDETFHSIFCEDKKYPLITFINKAEEMLFQSNIDNKYIPYIISDFLKVKDKIKTKNKYNPSLWGYKNTFLSALIAFNAIIPCEHQEINKEYDYEEEYQRIIKQEN